MLFRSSGQVKALVLKAITESTSTNEAIDKITKIINETENISFTAIELLHLYGSKS